MAAGQHAREERPVGFLDQEAFGPTLGASSDGRADADRAELQHVGNVPEGKHRRYREGAIAWGARERFRAGLSSSAAQQLRRAPEGCGATGRTRLHTSAGSGR